jgi:inosine-uridine nucleoside N-ribohydrolase
MTLCHWAPMHTQPVNVVSRGCCRCLRNVVALFHVLEKEMAWRESVGKPTYGALGAYKPIVAVGAQHALEDEQLVADHFHGADGLHGVHDAHPHLSPADTWRTLFEDDPSESSSSVEPPSYSRFFTPSKTPAPQEMLRILREEPEDTVTIVAIGPLTNVALAASEDPETFLRVKELVVMGGAVEVEGNVTPCAEFNCMADAVAAARVFALTSPVPSSTMPPAIHGKSFLPPYPAKLSRQLKLTLFPLDITTPHEIKKRGFNAKVHPLKESSSPLAQWTDTFMTGTFGKIDAMLGPDHDEGLSLHDPLCIWYMMTRDHPGWKRAPGLEDIRIETSGQWTRGMHVIDKRSWAKPAALDTTVQTHPADPMDAVTVEVDEIPGDNMDWLSVRKGNRINRVVGSPVVDTFADVLLDKIFA